MLFKKSLWLACGRVSNGLSVKINEWEEEVNCKHYHPMSSLLTFGSLRVSETKRKSKADWTTMMMKVIWKMSKTFELICVIFRDFSQGNPSFDISHHRCMLHCHCFVVVLILWLHIFHHIHLPHSFFFVIQGKITYHTRYLPGSVQPLPQTCLRSKGKLHEIYHFEAASHGFSYIGHLFVSMKSQWLIKLKYVWLAINFRKTMQWKVCLKIFCWWQKGREQFYKIICLQPFNPQIKNNFMRFSWNFQLKNSTRHKG